MDFFGAQDAARRRTWQLAGLFGAAVVSLVVLTNLLVATVYAWALGLGRGDPLDPATHLRALPAGYWFWITLAVVGTVALACLYKYLWLRGGGKAVAESLGGELIHQTTRDPLERRLLNVVAEMAIAAGLPVPPVYVIPEPGINAFAAGLGFGDAVIGVTRGTLAHLDRDELQGVIGHEFSHLLNGDSRLNLRLLALLHGILFIGLVGEGLLRGAGSSRARRGSGRGAGSAGLPFLVLGLGLTLIGYTGTLFGKLIKAAVSRQREFLADAAAVQFTRNPDGIADALKKIGGLAAGSRMRSAAATEASHLFFGPVAPAWFGRLTATHPPLEQRIRAIDRRWDGRYPVVLPLEGQPDTAGTQPGAVPGAAGFHPAAASPAPGTAAPLAESPAGSRADGVAAAVGRVDDAALEQAIRLIDGLPAELHAAAHDPWAARALLFALVIANGQPADGARAAELLLGQLDDHALAAASLRLAAPARGLDEAQRLVLVELAMPALKELSAPQYARFSASLVGLIRLDRRVDLFEWVLHRLLRRDLQSHFSAPARDPLRHRPLEQCAGAVAILISALAREAQPGAARGAPDPPSAFRTGLAVAGIEASFDALPDPDFQRLNRALAELRALAPLQKPRLIKACAATVLADERVSARQGALLQGIAAALDCPLPPSIHAPSIHASRGAD